MLIDLTGLKTVVISILNKINLIDTSKMNKENPTGTGSFSLNREADTGVGDNSVAIGSDTVASGFGSLAEGIGTIAASEAQHVQGRYNIEDNSNTYAHITGSGFSESIRNNVHTIDWFVTHGLLAI